MFHLSFQKKQVQNPASDLVGRRGTPAKFPWLSQLSTGRRAVLSDLGFRRFLLGPWESGVWGRPLGSLSGCRSLMFLDVSAVNFLTLWDRQEGSLGPGDDVLSETYLQVSVKGMSVTSLDMMAMCDTAFCPPVSGG